MKLRHYHPKSQRRAASHGIRRFLRTRRRRMRANWLRRLWAVIVEQKEEQP